MPLPPLVHLLSKKWSPLSQVPENIEKNTHKSSEALGMSRTLDNPQLSDEEGVTRPYYTGMLPEG